MYWRPPIGFETVISQQAGSGVIVKVTIDAVHTRRSQAKYNGQLVVLFRVPGNKFGIFKRADLCIELLR